MQITTFQATRACKPALRLRSSEQPIAAASRAAPQPHIPTTCINIASNALPHVPLVLPTQPASPVFQKLTSTTAVV